jgi:large subunit ribosomal protein L4
MEERFNLDDSNKKKKAIGLIHKVYLSNLKNSRDYTASTKTKSEVRGGGRKPWRQKGTGQARAGSSRSPLWVGGGVIFGPKPRIVFKKINKKERKLAIFSAFYLKKKETKIVKDSVFVESINLKTKSFFTFLKTINLSSNQKLLVILPVIRKNLKLATQNIKNIELTRANSLNITQLLNSTTIIVSEEALRIINTTYGKSKQS